MGQPAGHYWAEGDPPNTTRYWNGTSWEGPPVAWFMARQELQAIDAGRRDPSQRSNAKAAMIIGIIGTVLTVVAIVAYIVLIGFLVTPGRFSRDLG